MKKKKITKNILAHITLTILAVIWVMPLIWIILTSFRAQKGAYTSSFFPKAYTLDNYTKLFTDTGILNFPRMFENTLIVAVFSCIISTFFVLSVAYCMSRLRFRMRKAMMNVAMILGLFPAFMAMVAVYYAHMLRHYGGLPIIDKVISPDEASMPTRATLQQTVDFIVRLLNEAIDCPEFPWHISEAEMSNWDGRLTKAGAMGLKARVLLFVASPLFNNDEPYFQGAASEALMTWFGNYDRERWKHAMDACEAFFKAVDSNGFYKLVEKEDVNPSGYRYAFRAAYFDRGTTETLISVRRENYYKANQQPYTNQSIRWGAICPTKEYFDMFPTADGENFDWSNPEHTKNPFMNRDPRLSETFILDGDLFQNRTAGVTQEKPDDKENYPAGRDWNVGQVTAKSLLTGLSCRKWGLDRAGEYNGHIIQWPHLRIAEIYLSYAEALNEYNNGPNELAYHYVDKVRARVGMKGLKKGLSKEEFRKELLRERACEFGYEEVRFFDLIRWKMKEKFSTPLHGLNIYKNKNDGSYICEEFPLLGGEQSRSWWNPGGFSEKWYLSAFPQNEINKGYGLVQNPGWE